MYHEDLQKIACLFLEDGKYGYERIVPKHWIDEMRSPQVRLQVPKDKPTVLRKSYYGYYLWIGDDGTYFADGTNGQYLILPSKRRVAITVLSDQDDTRPMTNTSNPDPKFADEAEASTTIRFIIHPLQGCRNIVGL